MSGLEVFVWAFLILLVLLLLSRAGTLARDLAAAQSLAAGFSREAAEAAGSLGIAQAALDAAREAEAELSSRITAMAVEPEPLTQAQKDALRANQCVYCGGSHVVAISSCPRIRRMRFRGDGQTPMEVEFWPWGDFPTDGIVWPEEYA